MEKILLIFFISMVTSYERREDGSCIFQHNDCRVYKATCTDIKSIPVYFMCYTGDGFESSYETYRIQTLTLIYYNENPYVSNIQNFRNLNKIIIIFNGNLREIHFNNLLGLSRLKEVKASHNSIETVYAGRGNLSDVENVDLSYNCIETIPNNGFAVFSQLKSLDLSHNLIKELDILTFEGISELAYLDISHNVIQDIGHSFVRFINVKELILNDNNVLTITEPNFKTMVELQKLNVSFNQLTEIENNSFRNLVNIEELDLSNNKLEKISSTLLQNNTKLHTLYLANNPIQIIEPNAFHGKSITHFSINGICLGGAIGTRIFDGIVTNELNLSFRKISSLEPEAFSGMQVNALNLSNNVLTKLSRTSFRSIQLLEELDLSNNNLSTIDFETTDLKQLVTFFVQNNFISKINKITFQNFESLKTLDLSHNKISELEPELFIKMNKLEYLDISYNLLANSLTSFCLQGLISVNNIKLNHNRFTSIENNTFSGLRSLKILNCSYGEITNIGFEAFHNTSTLEVLDLSNNLIRKFVINSTTIAPVKELRLNDNALNNFTEELSSIEHLNLANNNIVKFQTNLFALPKNFTKLDLSSNNVIEFEDMFKSVSFLYEFVLKDIKKQFNFENVVNTTIIKLDISYNNIYNINTIFLYKINGIKYLNLNSNKITFIDKFSFQTMAALISLDLSSNLITFIQPGSFLHLNALQTLNLHKNSISALQFGVLDGLHELRTLNLSSNTIHEFTKNSLLKTPMITTIALDNNMIKHINFEEFVPSYNIRLMTVGGNPISCLLVIDAINNERLFSISAETLDYHSENVDGITCITNFNFNKSVSIPFNDSSMNSKTSFSMLAKAIDGFSESAEKNSSSLEKVELKNNSKNEDIQTYILNALNSIDINTKVLAQHASLKNNSILVEETKKEVTPINTKSNIVKEGADYHLQDNINTLNEEKDKILKELHEHVSNLKQEYNGKSEVQMKHSDDFGDLKGVLHFVAACLTILIVLSLSFIAYKIIKSIKPRQRNNYLYHSSRQPLDNVIELQSN